MQSGSKKTDRWKVEFEPSKRDYVEPLMGWVAQEDTQRQVDHLFFESKEQAIMYAEENGLDYRVVEPHKRRLRPKSYADNFRHDQPRKTS